MMQMCVFDFFWIRCVVCLLGRAPLDPEKNQKQNKSNDTDVCFLFLFWIRCVVCLFGRAPLDPEKKKNTMRQGAEVGVAERPLKTNTRRITTTRRHDDEENRRRRSRRRRRTMRRLPREAGAREGSGRTRRFVLACPAA